VLTTYVLAVVLFVNMPIGLAAASPPRVLGEAQRQRGRFDLPGAATASGGWPPHGLS
jgi:hypothetical protein